MAERTRKIDSADINNGLAPRAYPKQARSQASIARILGATQAILLRDGPSALTTPAIAAESGISVGVLYRYFPNKEAIVLALYEQRLAQIRAFMADSLDKIPKNWRAYIRKWVYALRAEEKKIGFDPALYGAFEHFPRLAQASTEHLTKSCDIVVAFLQKIGVRWPEPALFDLAVHMFFINVAAWHYSIYAGSVLPQGSARLADNLIAVIETALKNPAPPPPYASRISPA